MTKEQKSAIRFAIKIVKQAGIKVRPGKTGAVSTSFPFNDANYEPRVDEKSVCPLGAVALVYQPETLPTDGILPAMARFLGFQNNRYDSFVLGVDAKRATKPLPSGDPSEYRFGRTLRKELSK